ncbi:MAG: di-trans,poly-cis-decaprenylcistransferase [Holosporales bacterium]|jgi:undecaprenyl diphosphate synthase|nr:di-trans,poly-cis-decaprenylcistransferase [Holosporales bacterium]
MSVYKKNDPKNSPEHIAFIMDGNSTWAKRENKDLMDGYKAGMKNMANIILSANDFGLKYATFYVFSSENWERPRKWVSDFMSLSTNFLKNDDTIRSVLSIKPKIKIIGDTARLNQEMLEILSKYEDDTKNNAGMTICLAISYGGRDEIIRAAKKIAATGLEFSEKNMSIYLDTSGIPDPALIIRTGGHQRLSNFLLWQSHYSELFFSQTLWPDFKIEELNEAITKFARNRRTYGK